MGSTSTIRHHRFALKEKERQAKTFLAIMELLKEKDEYAPAFLPVHKTATMVDDRYNITEEEQEKILKKYFPEGTDKPLVKFPPKEKQRLIVLRELASQLQPDRTYGEKELNQALKDFYEDYALIRRYLIDYGFWTESWMAASIGLKIEKRGITMERKRELKQQFKETPIEAGFIK